MIKGIHHTAISIGDFERARAYGHTLLELRPNHATALVLLSDLSKSSDEDEACRFQSIIDSSDASLDDRIEASAPMVGIPGGRAT